MCHGGCDCQGPWEWGVVTFLAHDPVSTGQHVLVTVVGGGRGQFDGQHCLKQRNEMIDHTQRGDVLIHSLVSCAPPQRPAPQTSPLPWVGPTPFQPSCPGLPIPFLPPPPFSCWEWRLHFSCHLHSQSIRTPQLSRLAELGGRRRRERVLWGLSPPHRSHSAPDCFLLHRAQPGWPGRVAGTPVAHSPSLEHKM